MVRVVKMGPTFYGVSEKLCEGDFWEDVKSYAAEGEPVIVAADEIDAEAMCSGSIKWVRD